MKIVYALIGAVARPNVSLNDNVTVVPVPTTVLSVGRTVSGPAADKLVAFVAANAATSLPEAS